MEKERLISRHKGSGRSKVEVEVTEKGRDVFKQSLHNETDRRIFAVPTLKERERLASYLFKVRRRVFDDLGIPEWQLNFPVEPNAPGATRPQS